MVLAAPHGSEFHRRTRDSATYLLGLADADKLNHEPGEEMRQKTSN